METVRRGFGSDNHSGVHPRLLAALANANVGHAPSYGTDRWTQEAESVIRNHLGPQAQTFFVFNGTAANVLALGACLRPFEFVLTADTSHIANDECGAPEKQLGAKVRTVSTPDGKLTPELLKPLLVRRGDQHASQPRVISITQPTEVGTLYEKREIQALCAFAKAERLIVHLDGARLVNAAVALETTLAALTTECGVDVVSLGGTKNGLLFGEAVVFLNPSLSENFKYARKQAMQLPSKTRFIAAQFLEWLSTDLWREIATHSNKMAKRLSEGLSASPFARLTQKTQANGVFVRLPKKLVAKLKEIAFFYVMNELTFECRLMCTWDTEESDIDRFLTELDRLGRANPELARLDF